MRLRLFAFLAVCSGAISLGAVSGFALSQQRVKPAEVLCCGNDAPVRADEPKAEKKYPRGHKKPSAEVLKERHEKAFKRHDHRNKHLPTATPATFDIDALGWGTPVRDQGQCGSCWNVSACDTITCAYVKAGQAKGDGSFEISPQYIMDCENTGGCNGDDAPHVFEIAKSKGIPSEKDYGPYLARSGSCKFKQGTTRYAIKDYIFATSGQQYGFATTQEIKNAIVAYGMVSTAIAANSDWDNVGADGVLRYRKLGENDIDHDVNITGWDDAKVIPGAPGKGAFRVKNQWSESYGDKGYLWVAYGSHAIGYEACAVVVTTLPPPPPPTPPGPTPPPEPTPVPPTPPVPPGPAPAPGPLNGNIVTVEKFKDGVSQGKTSSYVPAGSAGDLDAFLKAEGINPLVFAADLAQLVADIKAKKGMLVIMGDLMKLAADAGLAVAEPAPAP